MSQKLFLINVAIITIVVFLILNAFLATATDLMVVTGAYALALLHVLSGFYMTRWAFSKPTKIFMTVVMGGMGIRLLLVGMILVILIKLIRIDIQLFIVTFGIYYILFQIVELYFINRGLHGKKLAKS